MVNASLNWASIVGIVLAVCGAGLYFMRSFKPALARDYDVFFAAIGLLCGGILFFQGWRLDPILQFGQFLLAGTTVFFGYESVRLRGIATDQARRSSYFDDEPMPPRVPNRGNSQGWDDSYDQFEDNIPARRRFQPQDPEGSRPSSSIDEDSYRSRRTSRAAIPEEAASRRRRPTPSEEGSWNRKDNEQLRRQARFGTSDDQNSYKNQSFGERRSQRQSIRRGTRPLPNEKTTVSRNAESNFNDGNKNRYKSGPNQGIPKGKPIKPDAEDVAFSPSTVETNDKPRIRRDNRPIRNQNTGYSNQSSSSRSSSRRSSTRPRDNSSRFDD